MLLFAKEGTRKRFVRLSRLRYNMHNVAFILFCVWHVFTAISATCLPAREMSHAFCFANVSDPQIGGRASCTFERRIDSDPDRFPTELPFVECKCPDSICTKTGDYRCVQVNSTFEVVYQKKYGKVWGTVELSTSCVCATSMVLPANDINRVKCEESLAAPLEQPV